MCQGKLIQRGVINFFLQLYQITTHSGLKQHTFIISRFKHQKSHWAKVRLLAGPCSFWLLECLAPAPPAPTVGLRSWARGPRPHRRPPRHSGFCSHCHFPSSDPEPLAPSRRASVFTLGPPEPRACGWRRSGRLDGDVCVLSSIMSDSL